MLAHRDLLGSRHRETRARYHQQQRFSLSGNERGRLRSVMEDFWRGRFVSNVKLLGSRLQLQGKWNSKPGFLIFSSILVLFLNHRTIFPWNRFSFSSVGVSVCSSVVAGHYIYVTSSKTFLQIYLCLVTASFPAQLIIQGPRIFNPINGSSSPRCWKWWLVKAEMVMSRRNLLWELIKLPVVVCLSMFLEWFAFAWWLGDRFHKELRLIWSGIQS